MDRLVRPATSPPPRARTERRLREPRNDPGSPAGARFNGSRCPPTAAQRHDAAFHGHPCSLQHLDDSLGALGSLLPSRGLVWVICPIKGSLFPKMQNRGREPPADRHDSRCLRVELNGRGRSYFAAQRQLPRAVERASLASTVTAFKEPPSVATCRHGSPGRRTEI